MLDVRYSLGMGAGSAHREGALLCCTENVGGVVVVVGMVVVVGRVGVFTGEGGERVVGFTGVWSGLGRFLNLWRRCRRSCLICIWRLFGASVGLGGGSGGCR